MSDAVWLTILMLLLFAQRHTGLSLDVSVGEDVLLPCVYTDSDLPTNPTVIWTDPKDDILLKVNKTKTPERVEIFPQLHHSGNFSIVLQDVRLSDSGEYECNILNLHKQFTTLKVTEKETPTYGARGGAEVTRPWDCHMIALVLSVNFLLMTK